MNARIVDFWAFNHCEALADLKFSSKLERINKGAFLSCTSLERITIPLKGNMITHDRTFMVCNGLKHVDLVEGALHDTIAALHLEDWRNDMNGEIGSINQILPNARAGVVDRSSLFYDGSKDDPGEKAQAIRTWIRSVIGKIVRYQAEHQLLLNDVAATLKLVLPQEIVNNVLPFLDLPPHTFEGEDQIMGEDDDDSDDDSGLW